MRQSRPHQPFRWSQAFPGPSSCFLFPYCVTLSYISPLLIPLYSPNHVAFPSACPLPTASPRAATSPHDAALIIKAMHSYPMVHCYIFSRHRFVCTHHDASLCPAASPPHPRRHALSQHIVASPILLYSPRRFALVSPPLLPPQRRPAQPRHATPPYYTDRPCSADPLRFYNYPITLRNVARRLALLCRTALPRRVSS